MYMWQDNSCANVKLSHLETLDMYLFFPCLLHITYIKFFLLFSPLRFQFTSEAPDVMGRDSLSWGVCRIMFHMGKEKRGGGGGREEDARCLAHVRLIRAQI